MGVAQGVQDTLSKALAFPFRSPVLEPGFDLLVAEVQGSGKDVPFRDREVLVALELLFKALQLDAGEGGSSSAKFGSLFAGR